KKLNTAGKLDEAIAAAEKVLTIERQVFGDTHEDVVISWQVLRDLHSRREDFAAARKAAQELLRIYTHLHGADHWQTPHARLEQSGTELLGKLSPEQRRQLAEAKRLGREAGRLRAAGEYGQGIALALKAAELCKPILGEDHPDYATSLNGLAMLYHQ